MVFKFGSLVSHHNNVPDSVWWDSWQGVWSGYKVIICIKRCHKDLIRCCVESHDKEEKDVSGWLQINPG